jgi:hypothetical protein
MAGPEGWRTKMAQKRLRGKAVENYVEIFDRGQAAINAEMLTQRVSISPSTCKRKLPVFQG